MRERVDIASGRLRTRRAMRQVVSVILGAAPLSAVLSCDAISGLIGSDDCTTIAVPAISVTVVDSVTHAGLSVGTTVRAREGTYSDSVTISGIPGDADILGIGLAFEHAGIFRVTVTHPGYIAWTVDNVRVTKDGCHVQTAKLTAELVRVP
jgi:hypothetical protein